MGDVDADTSVWFTLSLGIVAFVVVVVVGVDELVKDDDVELLKLFVSVDAVTLGGNAAAVVVIVVVVALRK